jgi:hypothetical protein
MEKENGAAQSDLAKVHEIFSRAAASMKRVLMVAPQKVPQGEFPTGHFQHPGGFQPFWNAACLFL